MSIQDWQAERVVLLERLGVLNNAIAFAGDPTPVAVRTGKNLRNTGGVTLDSSDVYPGSLLVFADCGLTTTANEKVHTGFVSAEAWASFQAGQYYFDQSIWKES